MNRSVNGPDVSVGGGVLTAAATRFVHLHCDVGSLLNLWPFNSFHLRHTLMSHLILCCRRTLKLAAIRAASCAPKKPRLINSRLPQSNERSMSAVDSFIDGQSYRTVLSDRQVDNDALPLRTNRIAPPHSSALLRTPPH